MDYLLALQESGMGVSPVDGWNRKDGRDARPTLSATATNSSRRRAAESSLKHLPEEIIVVCRPGAGWQSEDASRTYALIDDLQEEG
ncbi:MAG: hypothetical protein JO232_12875 [Verrucomicrobia bacterium]|nr:hypothetical protein [Verrucomicrobiota bacterium]